MKPVLVALLFLLAAGCASTPPNDAGGDSGRCLYAVSGPRGQKVVWAPCDQPPGMMRQRLTEPGEM